MTTQVQDPETGVSEPQVKVIDIKPGEIARLKVGPFFLNLALESPIVTSSSAPEANTESPIKRNG